MPRFSLSSLCLALLLAQPFASPAGAQAEPPVPAVPESPAQIQLSFAPVVKAATPAVVNIYATRVVQQQVSPFAGDPIFEQLFRGLGQERPEVQNSLGSGVIVGAEGIVVTNYHVVGQATEIRVVLTDRREYDAEVILGDEEADLAVLRLKDAADLPVLPLRDSDELEVGDLVLAIGNPFGVGQTVSSGIVSGLARSSLQVGQGRGYFIQTDAAINPGNSGGALVDMAGRLVGINTAILTRGGGSNGIGFAIPANLVATIVAQAKAGATEFQRPWAGITGQEVDAALASGLGLDRPEGVLVSELHPASPFATLGLQAGDVILSIDGAPTNTPQELMFRLSALGIGREADLVWMSNGARHEGQVTLAPAPDDPPAEATDVTEDVALRGLSVARVNPALIVRFDLPLLAQGVVVTAADDLAARAGLQAGDLLLAINGQTITLPEDVVVAAQGQTRYWEIALIRNGQGMRLRFRL